MPLQLLLVLSALLTGLTGLIAGERPVDGQRVERSAVASAAVAEGAASIAAIASEAAIAATLPAAAAPIAATLFAVTREPVRLPAIAVDERRLE